jgi:EAL domain-containing protein (putative c-di-GMP-specific phosphodiesterase class I)
MDLDRALSPVLVAAFNTVLAARAIHCVYQPIVSLADQEVAGYEALARGPAGTTWSTPEAMVGYAARVGRLPELDWICRAAACRGALAASFPSDLPLFVNVEPASSRIPCPDDLLPIIQRGCDEFKIVAEVTERSVASDPAGLLAAIEELRGQSNRIALDDVGFNSASQVMMSLVRPDVIELDRSIVQGASAAPGSAVVDAVLAEAERTGAVILAEGIETGAHLAAAKSMGATLGQGWLFGRPAALPREFPRASSELPQLVGPPLTATTPFRVAEKSENSRYATRDVMEALSRELEEIGIKADEPTALLTTFQHVRFFNGATRRRYGEMADEGIFTAAFAEGMPPRPTPRVRGCALPADDPLVGEWNVIVIGSQFAGGVFARIATTDGDEVQFELITSRDRNVVLAAARPLLQRLQPAPN